MTRQRIVEFVRQHRPQIFLFIFLTWFAVTGIVHQTQQHKWWSVVVIMVCWLVIVYGSFFRKTTQENKA